LWRQTNYLLFDPESNGQTPPVKFRNPRRRAPVQTRFNMSTAWMGINIKKGLILQGNLYLSNRKNPRILWV